MKPGHLILMLSSLAMTGVAWAEPPIGSRLGERLTKRSAANVATSARSARDWAACAYTKRPRYVIDLLDAADDAAVRKAQKALILGVQCIGSFSGSDFLEERRLSMPRDIVRGLLAEAAVTPIAVAKLQANPVKVGYQAPWAKFSGRPIAVDEMGVCVSDTNPVAIGELIKTMPYTRAEDVALAAVSPSLGSCLVAGAKLTGNRQTIRAALAEALYHRLQGQAAE